MQKNGKVSISGRLPVDFRWLINYFWCQKCDAFSLMSIKFNSCRTNVLLASVKSGRPAGQGWSQDNLVSKFDFFG